MKILKFLFSILMITIFQTLQSSIPAHPELNLGTGTYKIQQERLKRGSKRHLNAMIILDRNGHELSGDNIAMKISLTSAIQDGSYSIICSLSVLYNYIQNPNFSNPQSTAFDDLLKSFEIYEHKIENEANVSGLILLMPKKYKKKLKEEYKICNRETNSEETLSSETFNVNEKTALGFDLKNELKFTEINIDRLQEIKGMDKSNITRFTSKQTLEAIKDIFEKNKGVSCGGKWNIFITGHGSPKKIGEFGESSVADLEMKDFKKLIWFFDESETNFLDYNTCHGGGANSLQLADIKTSFSIIVFGATDYYTYSIGSFYKDWFKYLIEFDVSEKGLRKALRSVFEGMTTKDKYYNFPFVRFPKTDYFLPINPFPEEVEYLTAVKLKALKIEKKSVEIKDKKAIMFSPSIIPVLIDINQDELPLFISTFPGASLHFFSKINFQAEDDLDKENLIELLQVIGDPSPEAEHQGQVVKIFFIKEFKYKEIVLNNIVIDAYKKQISYQDNNENYYSKDFKKEAIETTPKNILQGIEDKFETPGLIPFIDRKEGNYGSKFLPGQNDNRFIIEFVNMNPVSDKKNFELLWDIIENPDPAYDLKDLTSRYEDKIDNGFLTQYATFIKQEPLETRTSKFLKKFAAEIATIDFRNAIKILNTLINKNFIVTKENVERVIVLLSEVYNPRTANLENNKLIVKLIASSLKKKILKFDGVSEEVKKILYSFLDFILKSQAFDNEIVGEISFIAFEFSSSFSEIDNKLQVLDIIETFLKKPEITITEIIKTNVTFCLNLFFILKNLKVNNRVSIKTVFSILDRIIDSIIALGGDNVNAALLRGLILGYSENTLITEEPVIEKALEMLERLADTGESWVYGSKLFDKSPLFELAKRNLITKKDQIIKTLNILLKYFSSNLEENYRIDLVETIFLLKEYIDTGHGLDIVLEILKIIQQKQELDSKDRSMIISLIIYFLYREAPEGQIYYRPEQGDLAKYLKFYRKTVESEETFNVVVEDTNDSNEKRSQELVKIARDFDLDDDKINKLLQDVKKIVVQENLSKKTWDNLVGVMDILVSRSTVETRVAYLNTLGTIISTKVPFDSIINKFAFCVTKTVSKISSLEVENALFECINKFSVERLPIEAFIKIIMALEIAAVRNLSEKLIKPLNILVYEQPLLFIKVRIKRLTQILKELTEIEDLTDAQKKMLQEIQKKLGI